MLLVAERAAAMLLKARRKCMMEHLAAATQRHGCNKFSSISLKNSSHRGRYICSFVSFHMGYLLKSSCFHIGITTAVHNCVFQEPMLEMDSS